MERLIEGEVRKRLDKYVNNSETFDIHNGNEFTLNNVTLKQEFAKTLFRSVPALAHLLEPFELRYGFAGKLRFKVPWATLRGGDHAVAHADEVLLCIRPIERDHWCVDDVREARQAAIQAAMTSMLNREKKLKRKKAGLRESIVAKIKHTLAVHVTNVHVRFESCGRVRQAIEQPFALGLTLGELRVSSGEKKGKKFTKVVDVGALSLYCVETDAAASTAMSDAELRTFMLAELRRTRPTAECLLQPVGGRL